MQLAERELLRTKHRPDPIRILLVGESPPAGGTFFYAADSRLYLATLDAFSRFIPGLREKDFLQEFRRMGFYLVDLCDEPMNHLRDVERLEKRMQGRRRLTNWLKSVPEDQPQAVAAVLKDIASYLRDALIRLAGRLSYSMSFPSPMLRKVSTTM